MQNIKAEVQAVMYEAADELERISSVLVDKDREIERLTREIASAGSIAAVNARQCEIITRLTRERDGLQNAFDHRVEDHEELIQDYHRLRAALELIMRKEGTDERSYDIAREAFKGEK